MNLNITDHMAKVKDRLIFESKKMDSFEQRKSNREQKLRAKEAHAHRNSEKAKSKKRHMQDVEDWAKSAASNRVGNNMVRDDDNDYLDRMNRGPNKKRQIMNKKYGHGGKTGRFKQNDKKSMNDMSSYNPKGGQFSGGQKSGGTKRKGKRARDAGKARR
jgi:rRNA-processing protein EBP2